MPSKIPAAHRACSATSNMLNATVANWITGVNGATSARARQRRAQQLRSRNRGGFGHDPRPLRPWHARRIGGGRTLLRFKRQRGSGCQRRRAQCHIYDVKVLNDSGGGT